MQGKGKMSTLPTLDQCCPLFTNTTMQCLLISLRCEANKFSMVCACELATRAQSCHIQSYHTAVVVMIVLKAILSSTTS